MSKAAAALKRLVVGRPKSSGELEHTLLPKIIALPVFSSDPLSSNAYATQEILLVLGLAGYGALKHVIPISFAVALLLIVVVTSYRQTVRAYPGGGGAYRVSSENLGIWAGLLAASALLLDYVLTVAVSVTAGVDAIVSAVGGLSDIRIPLTLAFIAFVTMVNLRGVRESGTLFAFPTYGFVLTIYLMIGTGFVRCLDECPLAESSGDHLPAEQALTIFLILKAFAAGTTALTGVEAIADGVQAFRYPQSRNAATTLAIMGVLSTSMFLGISWLANQTDVVYEEGARTVVAQVGHAVFGGGPLFYILQVMTAGILILAANTAFQDFPRLSSILAQDHFMPRQFVNRGDRLVFSNGVLILATLASVLVVVFKAELNALIQLYLVGVFISFTLSQTGMFLRWRKIRDPGWRRRASINGFGAVVTGIVFCVIVSTKFLGGAWIIVCAIPVLIYAMHSIHKHYSELGHQLQLESRRPVDRRPGHQHIVILVNRVDASTARALGYARSVRPADIRAVGFDPTAQAAWKRLARDIPIDVLPDAGSPTKAIREYLRQHRTGLTEHDFLTIVIPEILQTRSLFEVFRRPSLHRLKASLLREPGVQVLNVPMVREDLDPEVDEAQEPVRNYVCVLVSGVHNATLQAIEYAETLQATDIRALSFAIDPDQSAKLGEDWLSAGIPHPLEIEAAPFRDLGGSMLRYIAQFDPDGVDRIVTIVLPEFVVKKTRHQFLHGQTALVVKRRLLFARGVVVVSVPYHM